MHSSVHTRSDAEPIDSSLVQSFVSEYVTDQYINMALLTVVIYHWVPEVLTMDKEVKYFWSNPRNATYALQLSRSLISVQNRYVGVLGAISAILNTTFEERLMICQFSTWTQGAATLAIIVLIDYILLIRVLAFYSLNKILGIFLKALLALEAAAGLGLLIYGILVSGVAVKMLAEGVVVCGQDREPPLSLIIISWTIPMAYGLLLLALALYKAIEHWKLSREFNQFHLITVLVQDQVCYYIFVVLCCSLKIIGTAILNVNPFVSDVLDIVGSRTLLCILGAQLSINLKEAGEKAVNGGTDYKSRSDIHFV